MASYWQREAGWRDRWHDVALPASASYAILGGGLSGLATALRVHERAPDAAIVVLEAERVGFGASGRSAGFLSPLATPVWLLGAHRSTDHAWAMARLHAEVHAVAAWLADIAPTAELAPATLSLEARGRVRVASLAEFVRAVETVGLSHRASRGQLAMEAYTLHPYRLVRALAEHAVQRGIVLRERARVIRVDGTRVVLASGEHLSARRIVVCTNAYTPGIDIGERVRPIPVHSFLTATAPLAPATIAQLERAGDFTVEVSAMQAYHRMHGGRLVYGGIDRLRAPAGGDFAVPDDERARLASSMRASFPRAGALPIAEAWSGVFHTTTTGLPVIRRSRTNPTVVFNIGYGGTGVALALACATLAAAVATGAPMSSDHARLLATIRDTRLSAIDGVRALARIARRFSQPWRSA